MGTFIVAFHAVSQFMLSEVSALCMQHAESLKCVAFTPEPACCLLHFTLVAFVMNDSTNWQLQNVLKPFL